MGSSRNPERPMGAEPKRRPGVNMINKLASNGFSDDLGSVFYFKSESKYKKTWKRLAHMWDHVPNLVFLTETMLAHGRLELLRVRLGFSGKLVVDLVGHTGGLCLS
ncbi:hypothetical protein ACOSP7_022808 [Xanthoceras sorbifolium]